VSLEEMSKFFENRLEGYEEHMLFNVTGYKEACVILPTLITGQCEQLLDLGCGTGLELENVFKAFPNIQVTGIDLTQSMLDKLQDKYKGKSLQLICGSYFDVELATESFDCAISFQTMHHFSHEAKIGLYKKIFKTLKPKGTYIECDYMVETQEEEDYFYREYQRFMKDMDVSKGEFYHYDIPCTLDNQMKMLKEAGFIKVEKVFKMDHTAMILAVK
jgi:ubiquinone/menaquinone biosynthesis C-methylase UbiE